ncbi:unnamed protein product, partial [Prorocentrum cordatum]
AIAFSDGRFSDVFNWLMLTICAQPSLNELALAIRRTWPGLQGKAQIWAASAKRLALRAIKVGEQVVFSAEDKLFAFLEQLVFDYPLAGKGAQRSAGPVVFKDQIGKSASKVSGEPPPIIDAFIRRWAKRRLRDPGAPRAPPPTEAYLEWLNYWVTAQKFFTPLLTAKMTGAMSDEEYDYHLSSIATANMNSSTADVVLVSELAMLCPLVSFQLLMSNMTALASASGAAAAGAGPARAGRGRWVAAAAAAEGMPRGAAPPLLCLCLAAAQLRRGPRGGRRAFPGGGWVAAAAGRPPWLCGGRCGGARAGGHARRPLARCRHASQSCEAGAVGPVRLRGGLALPPLGLGTGKPSMIEPGVGEAEGRERLVGAVAAAVGSGYRLVDAALYARTEADVVAGVRHAGVDRSEVVVATKLLQSAHRSDDAVRRSVADSLQNLGANSIDLYFVHNPRAGRIRQVWPLLTELRKQGLVRALGVSNFGVQQLEGMRLAGLELPEINQVEVHCWRQMPELLEYHRQHGIATMCMSPLAKGQMFNRTDLASIAEELGQPEASVAIRWAQQLGLVPIPRSLREQHIVANAATGFSLSADHIRLDSGYVASRGATPAHALPWELVADSVPDKALWDESKKRKAEKAARKAKQKVEWAKQALAKREQQMRAREAVAAERRLRAQLDPPGAKVIKPRSLRPESGGAVVDLRDVCRQERVSALEPGSSMVSGSLGKSKT